MDDIIEVAPLRLGTAFKGLALIYGLTIVTCLILNEWMQAAPIGPWVGDEILKMYWFDNVTFQLSALWWALMFIAVGFWPFNSIENPLTKGISIIIVSWILGWLMAKSIYWLGLGAGWVFPIVGCIYFLLVFFSFTGENWVVANLSPARQFYVLLLLIWGLTYIITNSDIRWIPAWWFPFVEMGLATGLLSYLTRKMTQPSKAFIQIMILFLVICVYVWISKWLGVWDNTLDGVSTFWNLGYTTPDNVFLLWFMLACGLAHGVLIPLHNWPFTKIPMPWGGIAAVVFILALTSIGTMFLKSLVGTVFSDINEAMTYAYMGVNWSFVVTLIFGFGYEKPYLWTGQKTPGTWDDVDG